MAVTILFKATRSANFQSVAIEDNGTAWTTGGDMDKANVTAITLSFFGTDKVTALKVVTFTAQERTDFLAGGAVTLLFSDARLWSPAGYAPDDFYTLQLTVSGGSVVDTQVAIDSYFYIKKMVMDHILSVTIPLENYYEANSQITGDLAAMTELDYLSSVLSIARENKWRKVYDYLAWIYNV